MKRHLIVVILVLFSSSISFSYDQSFLYQANVDYDKGQFLKAQSIYKKNNFQKFNSASLYYNMANFAYRNKKLAKSLLYLTLARQLAPRDPDIAYNLNYISSKLKMNSDDRSNPLLLKKVISTKEILKLSLVFLSIILVLSIIMLYKRHNLLKLFRVIFISLTIFSLMIFLTRRFYFNLENGVVIDQEVNIYSGPSSENIALFKIHYGNLFKILEKNSENSWLKIKLTGNKKGWVNSKSIFYLNKNKK